MTQPFQAAKRLDLPGYPFAELERKASAIKATGGTLLDLSIGDPDLPAPKFMTDAAIEAFNDPRSHLYPSSRGDLDVRKSVSHWFKGRFGVELDPRSQVCILSGAKEGLGHIARAVVNPGDVVSFPDPAYPVYGRAGCQLVEGKPNILKLDPENGFLPSLNQAEGSRLLYLNYPNNPTGAVATDSFLSELADLAESDPGMTVAYDMAYSELSFQQPAKSILQYCSSAIEFHSLSKMANATGFRVGFVVGEAERIQALTRVKEEMDSGAPLPCQRALAVTLDSYVDGSPPEALSSSFTIYRNRRNKLSDALTGSGFEVFQSDATFYVWFKVGDDELPFIGQALDEGLLLTPGRGFGKSGKGWVRASVTAPDNVIDDAIRVLNNMSNHV